jgi:hypothetical protein
LVRVAPPGSVRFSAAIAQLHLDYGGHDNASLCDDAAFITANLRTMVDRAKANQTIPLLGTIPPNFRNDPCPTT